MNHFFRQSLVFISIILIIVSCKKEGCTDLNAANYNNKAKKDNGSCTYEGSVVFWYDLSTSSLLETNGVTELTYILNNTTIGTLSASTFWNEAPECGSENVISVTYGIPNDVVLDYEYSVLDQNGNERFSGTVSIKKGDCVKTQLQ